MVYIWLSNNYIEVFGAVTGLIYVFLEIRQTIWLWPVGIITSAVYIWVFFTGKLYADMSLQGYYLIISCLGLYWWMKGSTHISIGKKTKMDEINSERYDKAKARENQGSAQGEAGKMGQRGNHELQVSRLKPGTGLILGVILVLLFIIMWIILSRFTDSPVPVWDSFLTSASIIATWMLARKIYEHWFLWIVVNSVAAVLFLTRGLYPTAILYFIYGVMSFAGLAVWKKSIRSRLISG